jgi:hypothetical protein
VGVGAPVSASQNPPSGVAGHQKMRSENIVNSPRNPNSALSLTAALIPKRFTLWNTDHGSENLKRRALICHGDCHDDKIAPCVECFHKGFGHLATIADAISDRREGPFLLGSRNVYFAHPVKKSVRADPNWAKRAFHL